MPALSNHRQTLIGIACCATSALAYTMANVCMRQLATLHCDFIWAVFCRETVTAILVLPCLVYDHFRGRPTLPSGRALWELIGVGVLIEVVGNIGVMWAFGVTGLAATVPAVYGAVVVVGAMLGYFWLGEPVSRRGLMSIFALIAALILLGLGTGRASGASQAVSSDPVLSALGILAGCVAGMVYAVMSISIRRCVNTSVRRMAIAFLIPATGTASLGPMILWRLGLQPLFHTPLYQATLMFIAGVLNLIGFVSLISGLQRITVAHANIISASQVGMAAVAGILLFHEPPNLWLVLGVCLTIVGIARFDRPTDGGEI